MNTFFFFFFKQGLWKTMLKPDIILTKHVCQLLFLEHEPFSLSLFSTDMEHRVIFYPIGDPNHISSYLLRHDYFIADL